jgi:hypothetical protein
MAEDRSLLATEYKQILHEAMLAMRLDHKHDADMFSFRGYRTPL